MPASEPELVHLLLEQQASVRPDEIAAISTDRVVTYVELNELANSIAYQILDHKLPPGSCVGICMPRGTGLVAALFGVLKSGNAFTPLDASMPGERLQHIVRDSSLDVIVCDGEAQLPIAGTRLIHPNDCVPASKNPDIEIAGSDLAYVVYTSGSTGVPKGVMVEHASLVNFACAQTRAFPVDASSRVLQFSSFAFDASISDIATAVAAGATIVCAERDVTLTPSELAAHIANHNVDIVTLPPSMLTMLDPADFPSLKVVVTVGQHCTRAIVDRWAGVVRLINGYGPTEATIGTTLGLQTAGRAPHIGSPLENTFVYLLDESRQPVAPGAVGEIYVGGAGVARGYLNRADLNKERFVADPFVGRANARMLKTFDRGMIADDGNLEILGRIDRVVKLHGQRIDLDDIEFNLRANANIASCAVLFETGLDYDDRLVAFVVAKPGSAFAIDNVRSFLTERLPGYMMPHAIHRLEELPVTISGKTDYEKLCEISKAAHITVPALENDVTQLLCDFLKLQQLPLESTFLGQGGDSIAALRLCNRMRSLWDVEMSTSSVLSAGSLRDLVDEITSQMSDCGPVV